VNQTSIIIFCLTYILGLLLTAIPWGGYSILAVGIGAAIALPRFLPRLKPVIWLGAGLVGLFASFYLQVRSPQPAASDISHFVSKNANVTVQGRITSTPRLTRSQRGQFWLEANQLNETAVTGRLYVTVPLLQATGLYPNQKVTISGDLYKPKSVANPGAFDFKAYLEREGAFAGLNGRQVTFAQQKQQWGWWLVQQRIVRSQARWLGSPTGPLVSSIVLGSRAVDLPYDIRDLFVRVGLAHALAASGFQTSLILGLVVTLGKRFSQAIQVSCGAGALIIFLCLTGLQPSVLRAVVMGFGVLIAMAMNRKIKPLGSLLLAATLLLLFNPLWIWDLGFELSFLATLGLVVTAPALSKRLDWLPAAIATLIAVPIAASIWTLPLQLHVFGTVPLYSLAVNIFSTLLISVISIGGIISALAALLWPLAGSGLAMLLYYPTSWLIELGKFFSHLPGNSLALGTISVVQLLAIYGIISLVWLQTWWRRHWWFAGAIAISLVLAPAWYGTTVLRVTVLATATEPVLVVQDQKVLLINSGNANTARFTVLPFLQKQGINQIDWAITINAQSSISSGWSEILQQIPVKIFYSSTDVAANTASASQTLHVGEKLTTRATVVQFTDTKPSVLQLKIQGQTWLLLDNLSSDEQKQLAQSRQLPHIQVLWWSGEPLAVDLIAALKPAVAIASSTTVDPKTVSYLQKNKVQLFWTERDGAIQWTPEHKFEAAENSASLLGSVF